MQARADIRTDRFFTMSLDMLCVARFDGYFVELNPAWERTLGWSVAELRSQPFLHFVHPDDRVATVTETMRLQAGVDTIEFENRYRCRDGSFRWLLWSATASQEERLYYAVARDITGRREHEDQLRLAKEEADRANQAKSEFLSRMSHELRTPLTSILGFSELLDMGALDAEKQVEAVGQIRKAGRHLLELINEVLDIARVEAGRLPLSIEPVAIRDVVEDAEDLIRPLADRRAITIRRGAEPDRFDRHVMADRQRLKQVLLNLLANAVKYCGGGCSVDVSVAGRPGGRVRLAVVDNGPGIDPAHLGRLFHPFERLGADTRGEEGSGIGLALSKRLVEAMGGEIGCDSAPGRGSTFWIDLDPAEPPAVEQVPGGEDARPAAREAAGTRVSTVLFVEDNLANVKLIEYVLAQRPGLDLIPAMQGRIGIALARQHHPDVILLDLNLPDLTGQDVLGELKRSAETAGIPVVVLSADATPSTVAALREAGAAAYLVKPLDVPKLLATLDGILDGGPRARSTPPRRRRRA